jgi:leader peptidase (prepilin peptidase)/N-methyltransferase
MVPELVLVLFAFLFGLAVGSFLNVVALRLPEGRSVVRPRSACPHCGARIAWFDNLPLLSYLLLRGSCRACGARISPAYPAGELAVGLLFALAVAVHGPTLQLIPDFLLLSGLVLTVQTDLRHWIVLDEVSIGGAVAGFGLSFLPGGVSPLSSALAGGGAFLLFLGIRAASIVVLRRRPGYVQVPDGQEEDESWSGGLGWGDLKLAAMVGAFLGIVPTLVALFIGFLSGALVGGGLILLRGRDRRVPVPFGPFLALGAAVALFWGRPIWEAYMALGAALA